jgi:hypothetical protein
MTEQSLAEEKADVQALAKIKRELNKKYGALGKGDATNGQAHDGPDPYEKLRSASINIVVKYRDRFEGRIIRRAPESKDFEGQPITGLTPYQSSAIWVHLHDREKSSIEAQVRDMTSP